MTEKMRKEREVRTRDRRIDWRKSYNWPITVVRSPNHGIKFFIKSSSNSTGSTRVNRVKVIRANHWLYYVYNFTNVTLKPRSTVCEWNSREITATSENGGSSHREGKGLIVCLYVRWRQPCILMGHHKEASCTSMVSWQSWLRLCCFCP